MAPENASTSRLVWMAVLAAIGALVEAYAFLGVKATPRTAGNMVVVAGIAWVLLLAGVGVAFWMARRTSANVGTRRDDTVRH